MSLGEVPAAGGAPAPPGPRPPLAPPAPWRQPSGVKPVFEDALKEFEGWLRQAPSVGVLLIAAFAWFSSRRKK